MINDVASAFSSLGLSLNPEKIKWVANIHAEVSEGDSLQVGGVLIPRSDDFVCLGSVISSNLKEAPAFEHRIARAWSCYHKWSSALESRASLEARLYFWKTTVLPSLLIIAPAAWWDLMCQSSHLS